MRRSDRNPVLTRQHIQLDSPDLRDVSSVFNPGAVMSDGVISLLLRVQNRGRETFLLKATSSDGTAFHTSETPSRVVGLENLGSTIYHVYDPRITTLDDQLYVTLAVDTDQGCRAILTRTKDLVTLEYVSEIWSGKARNAVLFPRKIDGKYAGLVRPNAPAAGETLSGSEIWLVESVNLDEWTPVSSVLSGRPHFWDELIGSGPPPVLTEMGWLHIYHGIATHFASANIYQMGVCLLAADKPSHVLARGQYNIHEPRENYEQIGQVPNVVFPTGMIIESYDSRGQAKLDSRVSVYYGAADTVVAVASTTVRELLDHCHAGNE